MKKGFIAIIIILFLGNCKEKYISPAITPTTGYLVVEGVINAGNGTTNIVLKRTSKLDSSAVVFEKGASVFVEGQDQTKFNLKESTVGNYSASSLNLNTSIKYRLNINTVDGKKYQSDFVSVQSTPPIDSVSWKQDSLGLHFFINTHDPTNQTKYYQWDYTETWEYHSPSVTYLYMDTMTTILGFFYSPRFRDPINITYDTTINVCWQGDYSKTLMFGATVSLSENKIHLPINNIPAASIKMAVLYSMNTRQYSLSEGKYLYLQKMKKNTEGTGSVFDAQPSELVGNIHCISNPTDPVIGYLDFCTIQEQRIFIKNSDLPNWNYLTPCKEVEVDFIQDSIKKILILGYEPIRGGKYSPPGSYWFAKPECIDCTLSGSNIKPTFWP